MAILGIFLGLLPGFVWLLFYLHEDLHPEPKRLIALTFVLGATAALAAIVAELVLHDNFLTLGVASQSFLALIAFALIEEFAKFSAAYLAVHKNSSFNEPVDAMIYMIVAALGFATIENLGVVNTSISQAALLREIFQVTSLRFVGATLLHALTAGLIGYYWAISIREFGQRRFIVWGILLATILHALFNYLIIRLPYLNLAFSTLLLVIVGFFVFGDFEKLKRKSV